MEIIFWIVCGTIIIGAFLHYMGRIIIMGMGKELTDLVGALTGGITGAIIAGGIISPYKSMLYGRNSNNMNMLLYFLLIVLIGAVIGFVSGMFGGRLFGRIGGKMGKNWTLVFTIIGGIVTSVFVCLFTCGVIYIGLLTS